MSHAKVPEPLEAFGRDISEIKALYKEVRSIPNDSNLEFAHHSAMLAGGYWLRAFWREQLQEIWNVELILDPFSRMERSVQLVDAVYCTIYALAKERFGAGVMQRVGLVTYGSCGRGEYVPGSDFDARIIFCDGETPTDALQFISNVTGFVFSHRADLMPSVQKLHFDAASEQEQGFNRSLLEERFVGGSVEEWQNWRKQFFEKMIKHLTPFLKAQCTSYERRVDRLKPFCAESLPIDIRENLGGLRDFQAVRSLGMTLLVDHTKSIDDVVAFVAWPEKRVRDVLVADDVVDADSLESALEAYRFLLTVRVAAHSHIISRDNLWIATIALGYPSTYALLQKLGIVRESLFRFSCNTFRNGMEAYFRRRKAEGKNKKHD